MNKLKKKIFAFILALALMISNIGVISNSSITVFADSSTGHSGATGVIWKGGTGSGWVDYGFILYLIPRDYIEKGTSFVYDKGDTILKFSDGTNMIPLLKRQDNGTLLTFNTISLSSGGQEYRLSDTWTNTLDCKLSYFRSNGIYIWGNTQQDHPEKGNMLITDFNTKYSGLSFKEGSIDTNHNEDYLRTNALALCRDSFDKTFTESNLRDNDKRAELVKFFKDNAATGVETTNVFNEIDSSKNLMVCAELVAMTYDASSKEYLQRTAGVLRAEARFCRDNSTAWGRFKWNGGDDIVLSGLAEAMSDAKWNNGIGGSDDAINWSNGTVGTDSEIFLHQSIHQKDFGGVTMTKKADSLGFAYWGCTGAMSTTPVVTTSRVVGGDSITYVGDIDKNYYNGKTPTGVGDGSVTVSNLSDTKSKHIYTSASKVYLQTQKGFSKDVTMNVDDLKKVVADTPLTGKASYSATSIDKYHTLDLGSPYQVSNVDALAKQLKTDAATNVQSKYLPDPDGKVDWFNNTNKNYKNNIDGKTQVRKNYIMGSSGVYKYSKEEKNWAYDESTGDFTCEKDSIGAIGIEVSVQVTSPKTQSSVYQIDINMDDKTVVNSSNADTSKYYIEDYETITTPANTRYLVAVPKSLGYVKPADIVKDIKGKVDSGNFSSIWADWTGTTFYGVRAYRTGRAEPNWEVSACSWADVTHDPAGFNIYILTCTGNITLETGFALPAQDLNHVYMGVVAKAAYPEAVEGTKISPLLSTMGGIAGGSDNLGHFNYSNIWYQTDSVEACSKYNETYPIYLRDIYYKVTDESTSTTNSVIAQDNASTTQGLLLANNLVSGGCTVPTRKQLKDGYEVEDWTTRRLDYAYNLNRYVTKDKRTLSALTLSTTAQQEWATNVGAKFGVIPDTNAPTVTPKRSDSALLTDKYTSKLIFNSYNREGNHKLNNINIAAHQHDDGSGTYLYYHKKNVQSNEFKPLEYMGYPCYKVTINITDSFYKYLTDKINNDKPGTNGVSRQNNDLAIRAGMYGEANYRMAYIQNFTDSEERTTVKNNDAGGILLTYYPEVAMRQYLYTSGVKDADGDGKVETITAKSDIAPTVINTIGEYKRKTYANSMYVFRLKDTDSNYENNVTGKIFSDDMSTGTQTDRSNNLPSIYSGSNITINADCVFTAEAYGYALDMVSYEDDKDGFVTQIQTPTLSEVKLPYSSVIQGKESDGSYINPMKYYQPDNLLANGKSKSKANLYKDYKNWVSELTNPGYWGADMTLKISRTSGEEVFNNFSTTVGSVKFNAADQKENGAYPIVIKHGVVVKEGDDAAGYKALIKQISADFSCTEAQAQDLFEKSGMYKAITNAIESDINDENKSIPDIIYTNSKAGATQFKDVLGTAYSYENGNLLGNKDHWYDESVRVFCIRRYETTGIKITGIMCNDKIDYSSAAKSNTNDTVNNSQAKYNNVKGKWYLTLYFKKGQGASATKTVRGIDIANEYDPKNYSGLATARGNGDVVLSESYIQQCDFLIPNASTSDMGD